MLAFTEACSQVELGKHQEQVPADNREISGHCQCLQLHCCFLYFMAKEAGLSGNFC